MVLYMGGADELGITIKSSLLSLSLDIGCWMAMFKDGSGNDASFMYMIKSRLAAKPIEFTSDLSKHNNDVVDNLTPILH